MSTYIVSKADRFLQQKRDYDWFITPCTGGNGRDDSDERVVFTTFPSNLTKADFEEYVDRKFSNLDNNNRAKMKALYKANTDIDMEKNVSFDYESDGAISAVLTQMLFERTQTELRVSVGYIKFTRRPTKGWHYLRDYWQSNTEKVIKALQYKYGLELKKELCYNS
ncbi:hypothetical protein I4U23_013429 [Adineta vaga]|nr:hypothetical protein I4U23_013429 [Adineta vaga]